ncbi:hypothetical protein F2P56_009722 [Juglans regia]|uniref:Transcription factor bHLH162 n=2 Tax=Juglans regia TaxID=51240 RepID=A0A2I4H8G2_JUGRE|nr:transcription factor bHLH162 [Juglans regia]KAF5473079.1 hypothetical protein F2P56_009722 [Juglans regia]
MENNPSSSRSSTDRKTIERNRRNQMKALYSELNSLVPHQNSREVTSLPDQLDEAVTYIKKMQINLEKMNEKKDSLMGIDQKPNAGTNGSGMTYSSVQLRSPQIEISEIGSALQVVLITGLDFQFMFNETIRVLHEEGTEIVNANFTVVDDIVFHTIHAKVGESALMGYEAARISERLKKICQY